MRDALYGFRNIVTKELLHILRDPTTLVFALLIPVLQLVLFGYAIDFDVRHVRTVVVDMDRSQASREYIARLQNTQYLDIASYLPTTDQAEQALRRNETYVAVIIPPDFGRRYGTARPPEVHVLLDGSNSQVAGAAMNALQNPPDLSAPNAVDARLNVLYNPANRTQVFTIPGLVCVLMQLVTVSLTSFSLVRERELGTLEQLMVSPVGRLGLMLGKIAPYSLLAMIELVAVFYLGRLIFDVQIVGSFLLLSALAVPFVLAALAMGLFISTVAQNQAQAMQMTMLTTMPAILLSGYIAPRETLPGPLYLLSDLFPVTHFIQISRAIAVRGAGLMDVLPSVGALILLTVLLILASTARFQKSVG
ncbi:MAG TPA: ABC transporter permease [Chthonomonadaceae bacterium]|nr:ABC transporter permease [Chthonomonadaceae bacterium]